MARFGKWQASGGALAQLGTLGRVYSAVVGYTQIGGFARSVLFKRLIARHRLQFTEVLDAGCGNGDYAMYLAETYPHAAVTATDQDPACLDALRSLRDRAAIRNLSLRRRSHLEIDDRDKYDLICCIDSLQYTGRKRDVPANFHAALRPGGHVLIRIPLPSQVRLFPQHLFDEYDQIEGWWRNDSFKPHYDKEAFERDLRSVGFDITCLHFTTGFWGRLSFELSYLVRNRLLYAGAVPVLKLLALLDTVILEKRSGDGMVVLCRRPAVRKEGVAALARP